MMTRFVAFLVSPGALKLARHGRGLSLHTIPTPTSFSVPQCPPQNTVPMMVSTETTQKKKANRTESGRGNGRREKKGSVSKSYQAAIEKYEPIIGVEVHVQLLTKTKAFCACSTRKKRTPNVNICPVCMGHPGALPVLNEKVVELAAKAGMALNCTIAKHSSFDRKNYYYADTAKNYQISQNLFPIAEKGNIELANSGKTIRITRLHMEEDAAKMTHEGGANGTGRLGDSTHSAIDFNRGGIPLIEIVTEPDLRSGSEAAEYGQELQRILRYIGASDCNMQDGSFRCDVNVSIRPKDVDEFGTRVELKNLNSFASVQKSVDFEIERQAGVLNAGGEVIQETRTWDEKLLETRTMRVKEGSSDYRYFPEPDIPPLELDKTVLEKWRRELPELPTEKRERFQSEYGLSAYDAFLLADDVDVSVYMDATVAAGADPKQAANWIMGDVTKILKFEKMYISKSKLSPEGLAELIDMISSGRISGKIAKELLPELVMKGGAPTEIVIERYVSYVRTCLFLLVLHVPNSFFLCSSSSLLQRHRNLTSISDPEEIAKLVRSVLDANPKELSAYKEVCATFLFPTSSFFLFEKVLISGCSLNVYRERRDSSGFSLAKL